MSLAYCCEVCGGWRPKWRLERRGDAVIMWACNMHLLVTIVKMQRKDEETEIVVRPHKAPLKEDE